ncbi:MAG TPA: TIGR00730 family Rossman fold protein [Opitutaceae bacterium]|jgi:hypothetical protein
MPKLLCVYCSSSDNLAPHYVEAAEQIGRAMPSRGWGLVYGGGKRGLMGAVATAVKAAGGRVVGVIPDFMKTRELAYLAADELLVVETMAERKAAMIARADAYLALPGGIGTLEEIAEVLTLRYLARFDKPAVFFNQNGFYDDLFRFFDKMGQERFRSLKGLYAAASTIEEIWPHLDEPAPYTAERLWQ